MYDLLIKSGRVIDPAQNIDDKLDIAISGDKIAKVAKDIPLRESQRIVDVAVDKKSLLYLDGTEIDYHSGIDKRGFVFNNPNATKTCGCGSSFQA